MLIAEKRVTVSKSLAVDKDRVSLTTLITALFYDLSPEKEPRIPTQSELGEPEVLVYRVDAGVAVEGHSVGQGTNLSRWPLDPVSDSSQAPKLNPNETPKLSRGCVSVGYTQRRGAVEQTVATGFAAHTTPASAFRTPLNTSVVSRAIVGHVAVRRKVGRKNPFGVIRALIAPGPRSARESVRQPGSRFVRAALRIAQRRGCPGATWKPVAPAGCRAYPLVMAFADPNNPDRPLGLAEIRARIARGEADADEGRLSDLDELLAEWEAEDEADRQGRVRGKPSAA